MYPNGEREMDCIFHVEVIIALFIDFIPVY
jgi:hypothetical protein